MFLVRSKVSATLAQRNEHEGLVDKSFPVHPSTLYLIE
jgi:hypothetical protein